jgi:hypothetical protein
MPFQLESGCRILRGRGSRPPRSAGHPDLRAILTFGCRIPRGRGIFPRLTGHPWGRAIIVFKGSKGGQVSPSSLQHVTIVRSNEDFQETHHNHGQVSASVLSLCCSRYHAGKGQEYKQYRSGCRILRGRGPSGPRSCKCWAGYRVLMGRSPCRPRLAGYPASLRFFPLYPWRSGYFVILLIGSLLLSQARRTPGSSISQWFPKHTPTWSGNPGWLRTIHVGRLRPGRDEQYRRSLPIGHRKAHLGVLGRHRVPLSSSRRGGRFQIWQTCTAPPR